MGRNPNVVDRYFTRIHTPWHEYKLQPNGVVRVCTAIPGDCWDLSTVSEASLKAWVSLGAVREVPKAQSRYATHADRDLPIPIAVMATNGT